MASPTDVPQRFAGKSALVTGAGSGVGRATAIRLAREGAQVLGHDINGDGLKETEQLVTRAGGTMQVRQGDVSKRDECFATVADAVAAFGKLDVLANVAGIGRAEHFTEVPEDKYRQMMAVNVDGYFFMCQAAIPHLLESGGNIVNVASIAGLVAHAYSVVYTMTKGAVVQLTRSLAWEYMKTPLRVNAVAPGGVVTALTTNYQMPADVDFDLVMPYTGHRGMTDPDDIANVMVFLASDEARNVNGVIWASDGGITAG